VSELSRFLAVFLFCLSTIVPALADPLDELFTAAQTKDAARAEAILAAADSPKLRRDMMWMLGGSHQDLRDFTQHWAEAQPENPVALTARAWSRYREAFLIRGQDSVRNTWPASLEQASPMLREAFGLADRALRLDPTYLPASDAVNIIGEVSGNMARSEEEGRRILEVAPNRHSLVIAASSVRRDWLGRLGVKTGLCDTYASQLPDAPGYTSEMCVIDAIYRGNSCCSDEREWAAERVSDYVDEPLMEETVLMAAAKQQLSPEAATRLRDRMIAEDRLTVAVALSGRPEIIHLPYRVGADPLTDFEAIKIALQRDLAAARTAADRDPGDKQTVARLGELYRIATVLAQREVGYFQDPPPDDIVEKLDAVWAEGKAYTDEMKARALALITIVPRNRDSLLFAATYLDDHLPDPLESAVWRRALYTNAVLYGNYRYDIVGDLVMGIKFDRSNLEREAKHGKTPAYGDDVLTQSFDCPYVRALRLFDASCETSGVDLNICYQNVGLSREAEFEDFDGVFQKAKERGACEAERTGPVESLRYEEIDLGL
jgi:hypothetical protein